MYVADARLQSIGFVSSIESPHYTRSLAFVYALWLMNALPSSVKHHLLLSTLSRPSSSTLLFDYWREKHFQQSTLLIWSVSSYSFSVRYFDSNKIVSFFIAALSSLKVVYLNFSKIKVQVTNRHSLYHKHDGQVSPNIRYTLY